MSIAISMVEAWLRDRRRPVPLPEELAAYLLHRKEIDGDPPHHDWRTTVAMQLAEDVSQDLERNPYP